MNANSNQGPPDLNVVFREVFSFLFKKRKQRKKPPEQNRLKRVLEKAAKKHNEKSRRPGQPAAKTNIDRQAQQHVQRQTKKKEAVSEARVEPATVENDTRTIAQRISDHEQSRSRPAVSTKAANTGRQNVSANSSRTWLHDPRSLRQAFILKELLEPPIALRKRPRRRYS